MTILVTGRAERVGLNFDEATGKLRYNGREVGECIRKDGIARVTFTYTYESGSESWFSPLSWFFTELDRISPKPEISLTVETAADSLAAPISGVRFLIEREVKVGGYIWCFHKNDVDPWPSLLHGHDYEHGLKLDVLTGAIYDVATGHKCAALKSKALEKVRAQLRGSNDYAEKVALLIDAPVVAPPPDGGE
jgi:hypothetical protein